MAGRRILSVVLLACVLSWFTDAGAQRYYGSYYVYPSPKVQPPCAPRGYKPFYISHLGRHGARYALTHYDVVMAGLDTARANGLLTLRGERFYADYKVFYEGARLRKGDLTRKGAQQHRDIAKRMYRRFPDVFKGETRVKAVSTTVPRVIMSMSAFLAELEKCDKSMSIDAEASLRHQVYIDPAERKNPGAFPRKDVASAVRASNAFFLSKMDWEGFAGRLFISPDEFAEHFDKLSFEMCVYRFVQSLPCLDKTYDGFDDLFTEAQLAQIFAGDNYRSYVTDGMCPQNNHLRASVCSVLLEEIMLSADSDIAAGSPAVRLRFSHDSALMPLMSLMDVNGMGAVVENPKQVAEHWRLYDIPMGCSLQFVFYRKKGCTDYLVLPLLNEVPARLPFPPVTDGFYSWNDFKNYYAKTIDGARSDLCGWSVPLPDGRQVPSL